METKEWLIVGALALAAFYFGRVSNKATAVATQTSEETDKPQPVQVIGGQPYYNLNFQMTGNVFNPLAQEYMPLFGFIGTRSAF